MIYENPLLKEKRLKTKSSTWHQRSSVSGLEDNNEFSLSQSLHMARCKTENSKDIKTCSCEDSVTLAWTIKEDIYLKEKVLWRLGYLDCNRAISDKGRLACELRGVEELVLTEFIFTGVLKEIDGEGICAL